MVESWLQEREVQAESMRSRAQQSARRADAIVWERFARQTARMKVTDQELRRVLPEEYGVASGLRVMHQGREHYLEHLIIGPTGIFLVETMEEEGADWHKDLVRNLAFFKASLGAQARFFMCLVIARSAKTGSLPPGAHLVDSLENALSVITDERAGEVLPTALAQEIWHLIRALAPATPMEDTQKEPSILRLEHLPHLVAMLIALILWVVMGEGFAGFFAGLVMFLLPTAFVMSWARRRPERMKTTMIAVIVVQLFFFTALIQGR